MTTIDKDAPLLTTSGEYGFNFALLEEHALTVVLALFIVCLIIGIAWQSIQLNKRRSADDDHITRKDFEEYKDHADKQLKEFKEQNDDDHKRMRDNFDRLFRSIEEIGRDVGRLLGRTEKD